MRNLLVTGGAGFIGANFVRYWANEHPEDVIIVLDCLTYAADPRSIADIEQAELVVGDIRDTTLVERLLRDRHVDRLVHFAAESHVDRSISGPDAFIDTNIVGTHSLLKAARACWLDNGSGQPHRFHHVSTDEVFGSLQPDDEPFAETHPYAPNSPYSASKAASDHLVRAYHQTYGLEVTSSHCSNNYGPFQHPEKLIPRMLIHALKGREMPVYGDGQNRRDWLHVEDHCRGIEACLARGRAGESYNLGGGAELANIDLVERLADMIDRAFADDPAMAGRFPDARAASGGSSRGLIRFVEDRLGHDRRYAIDDSKARSMIGYSPQRGFDEGLRATLRWYLENEAWWQSLLAR